MVFGSCIVISKHTNTPRTSRTRRNWTHYELCSTRRNTAKRGGAQISSARTRNHSAHAQALVSLAARPHSMHCPGIGSSDSQIDRGRRMTVNAAFRSCAR